MGEIKKIKARVVFKHEKAEDWEQSSYVPELGEKVLYDPDDYHAYTRVKYGDGEKRVADLPFSFDAVDYNENDPTSSAYIKNRPFYKEEKIATIEWADGAQFNESFSVNIASGVSRTYKMVSNFTPTAEELIGATVVYTVSGYNNYTNTITVTEENIVRGKDYIIINTSYASEILITYKDYCVVEGFEFNPEEYELVSGIVNKKGLYFTSCYYYDESHSIDSLQFFGQFYTQLDNNYITLNEHPEFISFKKDLYDAGAGVGIEITGRYDTQIDISVNEGELEESRRAVLISFKTYTPEQLEGAIVNSALDVNKPLEITHKTENGFRADAGYTTVHVAYNTDYVMEGSVNAP
jgi:hypothetical protein